MSRNTLSIAVGLTVTVSLCLLAFRNVPLKDLVEVLKEARPGWLLAVLAVCLADLVIRALRWRLLLSNAAAASPVLLFKLEAVGLTVNNVAFLRLGELARAMLASRELAIPAATALSSVAVERALDVAALLVLFNAAALVLPEFVLPQVRLAAGAVLMAVTAVLALLVVAEGFLKPGGAWERRLRCRPKAHDLISQLAAGAQILREPAVAVQVILLSLALWSVDAAAYWAAGRCLGLGSVVDYPRSVLILSWAGAGSALPAAPGAIGTFEAMVKRIVENLGASPRQALGFAVFTHFVGYTFVTILGMVFLYQVGLSLAGLKAALAGRAQEA